MSTLNSAPQMSAETVLIAAFSARALAQSAQRAGYIPLVLDCFGDEDTKLAAYALRCLPARVQIGFKKKSLLTALNTLALQHTGKPIGLVLGTGFECNPSLVKELEDRFTLLGNSSEKIQRVKDPGFFFETLTRLGIRHPETQVQPPSSPDGWLIKRIGGSGGLHIHPCPLIFTNDDRKYFQKWERGKTISLFAIASSQGTAYALSEQWNSPTQKRPYRYGGCVSGVKLNSDLEARMINASQAVISEFQLSGMISLDFILQDDEFLLLEVNPRPGATLDIFDDEKGSLFRAHLLALSAENPAAHLQKCWTPKKAAAAAYLYADQGTLRIPKIDWPEWSSDRPDAGFRVERGQPVATVRAEAQSADEAKALCLQRLALLQKILYEHRR